MKNINEIQTILKPIYPNHLNCNLCGYKQYDDDTIKFHCGHMGETHPYFCGACMDAEIAFLGGRNNERVL